MKILFFAEELLDDTNPTVKIARLIGGEWTRASHEVVYLCNDQLTDRKIGSRWQGEFKGSRCYYYFEPYTLYWRRLHDSGISGPKALIKNPGLIQSYLDMNSGFREKTAKKISGYIEKIAEIEKPDLIYAITEPYMAAIALSKARTIAKKRIYMGDPFCFAVNRNYDEKRLLRARTLEKQTLQAVEKVFVTDLAKAQYEKDDFFAGLTNKMSVVEFPNVRPIDAKPDINLLSKDKINCVFAGRFYEDIRRPEFLLDIFEKMPDNIALSIFGGGMNEVCAKYKEKMGNRLILHDFIPGDKLMQVLKAADVLVSLNNTAKNQVPSKLFEFFSLGRPVLNMCYIKDCPTLPYSEKYPLCENIFLEDEMSVNIEKTFDFIVNSNGQSVDYEDVEKMFFSSTPEYVAKELIS